MRLARACLGGDAAAWDRLVADYRPVLYAAARAIARDEAAARELADSLWAELYGVGRTKASVEPGVPPRSLLAYYEGRASLATWLRAVLAQRHVDTLRAGRRFTTLDPTAPDREPPAVATDGPSGDPDEAIDRDRYRGWFDTALARALAALDPGDRLRLGLYYAEGLTLAEIAWATSEHEATVSRKLARCRRTIKAHVDRALADEHRLDPAAIARCYAAATTDAAFDLEGALAGAGDDSS